MPTGESEPDEAEAARAANRFDIRRLIGGLFVVYGADPDRARHLRLAHVKNKAAGINIDLWTGIGMLVFGGADDLLGAAAGRSCPSRLRRAARGRAGSGERRRRSARQVPRGLTPGSRSR